MKKTFLFTIIIIIANLLTSKAQGSSNTASLGTFADLKLYECAEYNFETGTGNPFRITGHMPNITVDISVDRSRKVLEASFWYKREIKQLNRITKIRTFANTGNSIFFRCTLDDNTELSIQCQVNEGVAFIYYQNLDVVSLNYECDWNLLEKCCKIWYKYK